MFRKVNLAFNLKKIYRIYPQKKDRKQMLPVLWSLADSNRGHTDFQSDALPTELRNLLVGAPFSKSDTNVRHFDIIQNILIVFFKKNLKFPATLQISDPAFNNKPNSKKQCQTQKGLINCSICSAKAMSPFSYLL